MDTGAPKATLEFRELARTGPARIVAGRRSCAGVTPAWMPVAGPPSPTLQARLVLPDRGGRTCYALGPALLSGADVDSASVIYDSTTSNWAVDVHFTNGRFLRRIAQPLANHQIAIVLDDVVQSDPTVTPGITGNDAEIIARTETDTNGYSRTDAIKIAAGITGILPSHVRVSQ